jgi:hypothetical protein
MEIIFFIILVLVLSINLYLGFFLFSTPENAIKMQEDFYAKINWKMEPISMQKEIRNTKIMGMSLIVIAILMTICFFICRI